MRRSTLTTVLGSHLGLTIAAMLGVLATVGIPFFLIYVRTRWRIAGFYPYLGSYLAVLGLLLAVYPGRPSASLSSVGRVALWGILAGYIASVVGYLGLAFVPGGLERLANRFQIEALPLFFLAPLPLLLWLYGGLVGMAIGVLSKLRV